MIIQAQLVASIGDGDGGFFPEGVVADVFVAFGIAGAQPGAEVGHAQRAEDLLNQLDHAFEFIQQLIGADEKMGVIDGEAARARQSAQLAQIARSDRPCRIRRSAAADRDRSAAGWYKIRQ